MISPHYTRAEFACRCGCGFAAVDVQLIDVLERLRRFYNRPIDITSGCRCEAHNQSVGGAPRSYHVRGLAADVIVRGVPAVDVAAQLEQWYPGKLGIGIYPTWVHVDVREEAARWEK